LTITTTTTTTVSAIITTIGASSRSVAIHPRAGIVVAPTIHLSVGRCAVNSTAAALPLGILTDLVLDIDLLTALVVENRVEDGL
jgi:hypothetical protein